MPCKLKLTTNVPIFSKVTVRSTVLNLICIIISIYVVVRIAPVRVFNMTTWRKILALKRGVWKEGFGKRGLKRGVWKEGFGGSSLERGV